MAKAGASPDLLAKAVQLQKALADKGVPTEIIAEALSELLSEAGALNIPELKDLLQTGITSEDVAKIIALSKSFTIPNEQIIDIIPNGASLDSKDSVKAVLKNAFSNDMTKFAKSIIAQKAMTASGATPQTVAKVALLTKSMAENGMTANDIANALTMAMTLSDPDNKGMYFYAVLLPLNSNLVSRKFLLTFYYFNFFKKIEMVKQLETMIFDAMTKGGALSSEDIQMILALGEAMENAEDLIPPEAVRLFKTAMKQRRGSVDNVAETLMSSLTASGESKENVAKAMIKALKATGASPEEIAKTMYQAMEKAGASPEEMARVMAQALADSGASRKCSTIVQNFLAFSRNFLKNDFSLFFFF